MKPLFLALVTFCSMALAVTGNKVWRVPNGGAIPSWGPVNLGDGTNAITGALASKANLPSFGQQSSSLVASFSTSSTSLVDVTGASAVLTVTAARPVWVGMIAGGADANVNVFTASTSAACNVVFIRDSSITLSSQQVSISVGSGPEIALPVSAFNYIDTGAVAAAHTYKVQAKCAASSTIVFTNFYLVVFEM